MKTLDRVGEILREQGIDLNEMIESGREIRGELLKGAVCHRLRQSNARGDSSTCKRPRE
jgi:hypothetical protein